MAKNHDTEKPEENLESLLHDVMSPDEERRLQERYEQAMELTKLSKYDFDRVHSLLAECVVNDPGNVRFAKAMLENLACKHAAQKNGVRGRVMAGRGRLEKAFREGDWKRVLRVGANLLKDNPQDAETLRTMAKACEACNCPHVELLFLRKAFDIGPNDPEAYRNMAGSLARVERFDEAIELWEQIEEADHLNLEAPRMIALLTLEKARHSGSSGGGEASGDESAGGATATGSDAESRGDTKEKPRELVLTRRQELEQAIANNPMDEERYLKLADFLLADGRTFDAQQALTKGHESTGDPRLLERLEDTHMMRAKERVEAARQEAAEKRTPDADELVEKLREESHQLELRIFRSRLERNPDDAETSFQLGVRLKQIGCFRESLDLLKGGLQVPKCRAAASLEIAEILQRYHQFPKSLQFYRQATQLAAGDPSQVECRKRALYRAATLATTMKLSDAARQYLSELVKVDRNYRDTQTRLDSLQKIGND